MWKCILKYVPRISLNQTWVKYTNMEMTGMNEEVYTYRSPEMGFPCGSTGKESACNAGDPSSVCGLGRSPGEGKGYPLWYSGLENSRYRPWGCKELAVTERLSLSLVVVSPRNVLAHTQCDSLPASQKKVWGESSRIPRNGRPGIPCRATWERTKVSQEAEGERRAWSRAETLLGFSKEGMGEAQ